MVVDDHRGIATSPDGTNWIVRLAPLTSYSPLNAVAYGNGLFVAFGNFFGYWTSPDGITWTQRNSPGGINPKCLFFGNGRFIAAQGATSIYLSTTGTNWTRANPAPITEEPLGGVYGGGRFVLVGGRHTATSTDGMTWSAGSLFAGFNLNSVACGPSDYVAVGEASGLLYTSTNGSNWVLRSSSVSNLLYGVTYADGRYVAVGNQGQIGLCTNSTDWTPVTKQAATAELNAVAWLDDRFVAVGQYGTIAVSINGTDWEDFRTGYNSTFKAVTRGNGLFVAAYGSSSMLRPPMRVIGSRNRSVSTPMPWRSATEHSSPSASQV